MSQAYVGQLIEVETECLQLQTFQSDGTPAAVWTLRLDTITDFMTETRQLELLALKVKWASSPDADERLESAERLTETEMASSSSLKS
ncbi:MAG: hypothetical protein U0003_04125 [Vampirovibrionales bacterium]